MEKECKLSEELAFDRVLFAYFKKIRAKGDKGKFLTIRLHWRG